MKNPHFPTMSNFLPNCCKWLQKSFQGEFASRKMAQRNRSGKQCKQESHYQGMVHEPRNHQAERQSCNGQIPQARCKIEFITGIPRPADIKQIHRPGGAMYRPIQGHEWRWHHEWRWVSSKSHEILDTRAQTVYLNGFQINPKLFQWGSSDPG